MALQLELLCRFFATSVPGQIQAKEVAINEQRMLTTATPHLRFHGQQFSLLDTYDNPANAKEYFSRLYSDALSQIQSDFQLDELKSSNATDYKNAAIALMDSDNNQDILGLIEFLDIYENEQENEVIAQQLASLDNKVNSGALNQAEANRTAEMLLPQKPENYNNGPIAVKRNSGINVKNAKAYAKKHAPEGKYNRKYGYERTKLIFPADCTNFASQILYAGGIRMVKSKKVDQGWWWNSTRSKSISWVNANAFKNYMGSGYKTKKWKSFVLSVREGDFIAVDFGSDGSVDHIGFVYEKWGGRLKIAQHTRDYLDWNGNWPKSDKKGTYYRVRR